MKKLVFGTALLALLFGSCAPERTGVGLFYISQDHACGEIVIEVYGQKGTITVAHPDGIHCYSDNVHKFNLPEGGYQYTASSGCEEWVGQITIREEGCTYEELK